MGGEGAMMQANQSLKSNRKLLAKRKERGWSFVHRSTEKAEYDLPKATAETLHEIRETLQNENKSRRLKQLIAISFIGSILMALLLYFN